MRYVKDKQLINFSQKARNGFHVQNCLWAGKERLAGRMWPSGRTLPRSVLSTTPECLVGDSITKALYLLESNHKEFYFPVSVHKVALPVLLSTVEKNAIL